MVVGLLCYNGCLIRPHVLNGQLWALNHFLDLGVLILNFGFQTEPLIANYLMNEIEFLKVWGYIPVRDENVN